MRDFVPASGEENGHDIISHITGPVLVKNIVLGTFQYLLFLGMVYKFFRKSESLAGARFHFHKNQPVVSLRSKIV